MTPKFDNIAFKLLIVPLEPVNAIYVKQEPTLLPLIYELRITMSMPSSANISWSLSLKQSNRVSPTGLINMFLLYLSSNSYAFDTRYSRWISSCFLISSDWYISLNPIDIPLYLLKLRIVCWIENKVFSANCESNVNASIFSNSWAPLS